MGSWNFFCYIYIRFFNLTMIGEPPEQKEAKQNNNWNGMEDPLGRRPGQKNFLLLLGIEKKKMVNRKISHVIHPFWWTLLHLYWLLLVHVDDAVLITCMCSRWEWRGSLLHLRERMIEVSVMGFERVGVGLWIWSWRVSDFVSLLWLGSRRLVSYTFLTHFGRESSCTWQSEIVQGDFHIYI